MMDHLGSQQQSSEMLFHHQSVLQDIARQTGGRMIASLDQRIPFRIDESTAAPARIFLSTDISAIRMFHVTQSIIAEIGCQVYT